MENKTYFRNWIDRLEIFFDALRTNNVYISSFFIESPLSFDQFSGMKPRQVGVSTLEILLGTKIPSSLKDFYRFGATSINCRYSYQQSLFGGPKFWSETELPYAIHQLRSGASGFASINLQVARNLNNSFPLTLFDTGDLLLLNVGDCYDNPPVAFFEYGTVSFRNISSDFFSFLLEWEKVHYVEPGQWEILGLIDSTNGLLSSAQANKASILGDLDRMITRRTNL